VEDDQGELDGEGFSFPFLVLLATAHHGTGVASDAAGHVVQGESFAEQRQGPSSSIGDQIGRGSGAHN
jgi:hypothetical protein